MRSSGFRGSGHTQGEGWGAGVPTQLVTTCVVLYDARMKRVNVSLEDEQYDQLTALASQMHLQEGSVARSLLSQALDQTAGVDTASPAGITRLLYSIPGFEERLRRAEADIERGAVVKLDEF